MFFRHHSRCRRNPAHTAILLTWLAFLTALPMTFAAADTYTVGSDPACDFADLPSALFVTFANNFPTPTTDTIHLAQNQTFMGEFVIQDQSVSLIGGFSSCGDASPSGQTTIDRKDNERNLTIVNTGASSISVSLEGLLLTHTGSTSGLPLEGGSVHISGKVSASFTDTTIRGGHAVSGGGIYFDGTEDGSLTLRSGTSVLLNEASFGGGIACTAGGSDPEINLLDDAAVAQNEATNGAGLYSNGCDINAYASGFFSGIRGNEATGDGGGVYMLGNALLLSEGGLITDNEAQRGGGIFVTGFSRLALRDALISDNHAISSGGGIHAEGSAIVDMSRSGAHCPDLSICAAFSRNTVDAANGAAALYLQDMAESQIRQARFADNEADAAIISAAGSAFLNLEGVEFVGNSADYLVSTESSAAMLAGHLTVADNSGPGGAGTWVFHDNFGTGPSTVRASVFADDDGGVYGGMASDPSAWDCLLLSAAFGAPPSGTTYTGDADFIDGSGRDFRLGPDSAAIDLCDGSAASPLVNDRAYQGRGADDPSHPQVNGFYDAGAFEAVDVFSDDFESGDTSRWTMTIN